MAEYLTKAERAERRRRQEIAKEKRRRELYRKIFGPKGRLELYLNNKKCANVRFYPRIIAVVLAGTVVFSGIKWSISTWWKDDVVEDIPTTSVSDEIDEVTEEQRFKVPYTIKMGDTIDAIIYAYEGDTNKMYQYKDQILRYNDLTKTSIIYPGQEIMLFGVPASELEDYGYSCDYSLFDPRYELKDRASFLQQQFSTLQVDESKKEVYDVLFNRFEELRKLTKECYANLDDESEEFFESHLVDGYRNLCDMFAEVFGVYFEPSCYPLSEALEQNVPPAR